jgi:hypothetical protein
MTTLEQEVIALADSFMPKSTIDREADLERLLAAARLGEARMRERCAKECDEIACTGLGEGQDDPAILATAIRALKSELPG